MLLDLLQLTIDSEQTASIKPKLADFIINFLK